MYFKAEQTGAPGDVKRDKTLPKDRDQLCVALAHNTVVTWDVATSTIVTQARCSETCILYTAKFLTSLSFPLVVAAGTVFNQVVIWSPDLDGDQEQRATPLHRLTGHQGVIFAIDYNARSQRMCSASDDRSVRLYQLQFPTGATVPGREDWAGVSSTLLHVLYGHSARVWSARLLTDVLVSVGEDAACCVWDYSGRLLHKYKGHKGKSIWSLAVDPSERYVVTGGGDYSIRLWSLQLPGNTHTTVATLVLPHTHTDDGDFPRSTQLLDYNQVLVMTNSGRLLLYDIQTMAWTCLMSDSEFQSYTVMSVAPSQNFIAVGNIHGMLRLISMEKGSGCAAKAFTVDTCVYNGKLHSIHWLDDAVILTTGPLGELNIWRVEKGDGGTTHVVMGCRFELPESRHRWVAAAAVAPDRKHVVCGDKTGSVLLYRTHTQNGELAQKFHKIHGKAGVTDVCCHGDRVYTAGRDGQYRVYDWTDGGLLLLNSNRVCKGFEWIERLNFTNDGDTHILGFHTNQFVLWSVRENRKLLEVECGGGHRAWDFTGSHGNQSNNHGNRSRLVYLKARQVVVKTTDVSSNQTIVKSSLHGRELCDVKHICSSAGHTQGRGVHVIATCSEDTAVCISTLVYENGLPELRPLHTLTGHISSVRCLAVCSSSSSRHSHDALPHRKLIFSAGGRAQIKVWSVTVQLPGETNNSVEGNLTGPKHCDVDIQHIQHISISSNDFDNTNINSQFSDGKREYVGKPFPSGNSIINNPGNGQICESAHEQICEFSHASSMGSIDETVETTDETERTTVTVTTDPLSGCDSPAVEQVCVDLPNRTSCEKSDDTTASFRCDYESLGGLQLGHASRRRRKPWRTKCDNSDPETRILDLTAFHGQELCKAMPESLYFVVAACSDGHVRFFMFEEDTREITLITLSDFHDHCVLKVSHLFHKSEQTTHVLIATAATDGRVAFWDMTDICHKVAIAIRKKQAGTANLPNLGNAGTGYDKYTNFEIDEERNIERDEDTHIESDEGTNIECDKYTNMEIERDINTDMEQDRNVERDRNKNIEIIKDTVKGIGNMSIRQNSDCSKYGRPQQGSTGKLDIRPMSVLTLHQSGINSLHIAPHTGGTYLLVTGGDDNAVQVTRVAMEMGETLTMKVVAEGGHLSAHAAQVTGVWCLSEDMIVTASIDQRICIWDISTVGTTFQLRLVDCKFVNVSDIANIDVFYSCGKLHVLLCGEGLELLQVDVADRQNSRAKATKLMGPINR